MLADGERHPSTHKESPERGQRFGSVSGVKLVSIYTRARVGGSVRGLWRVWIYGSKYSCNGF